MNAGASERILLRQEIGLAGEETEVIFNPYEKHHSTVKDACELAEKLGIRNLVLYHTEDKNIHDRKRLYKAEGERYFSGNLYIPDDLETIVI